MKKEKDLSFSNLKRRCKKNNMAIWDFLTLDEEVEQEEKRVKSTYNPVNVGMFGFSDGVSGDRYTAEQLLSIPVAKACNDLICNSIKTLPIELYERVDDNTVRQFVFGNWGRLSIKEIADATNRTEEQIMAMQWRYNLPSLYNIEDENLFTFIELGEMLKLSRATMRRWTNEFGLKKQELNKGKKKRLVVDIRDVLPFLEANKDNMTSTTYNRCKDILEEYFSSNKLSATA